MSKKQLIAQFKVKDREFYLYLYHSEIYLELKSKFIKMKVEPLKNAWLSFADEATFEDVNEQINAFEVMRLTRTHLLQYLKKYRLNYFYFHASTPRKARIYPRFVQQLLHSLPNYDFCQENQSFYFYAKP